MSKVADVAGWMEAIAPLALSESWDNTGLLLGDPESGVERVMTCLTLTGTTVQEAVDGGVQLVIAHHPMPFKPMGRITTQSQTGRLVWRLATAGIAVYSPHTAWDSAAHGINALLAERMGLRRIAPLLPFTPASTMPGATAQPAGGSLPPDSGDSIGAGRFGSLEPALAFSQVVRRMCEQISGCRPRGRDSGRAIERVGIACGSGGSFLEAAVRAQCDLLITGEATFHTCLEAEFLDLGLLMLGHFASERFAMEHLAKLLREEMPELDVWAAKSEKDPVSNLF